MEESLLDRKDLKNVAMSLYIERRKNMPRLPKCRADIREALDAIDTTTNKSQTFTLVNDQRNRFHLGQNWWRRIQTIGLSTEYKERSSEVGKWPNQLFGLAFLSPEEIEDCFVEDIMAVTPQNEKCNGIKLSAFVFLLYSSLSANNYTLLMNSFTGNCDYTVCQIKLLTSKKALLEFDIHMAQNDRAVVELLDDRRRGDRRQRRRWTYNWLLRRPIHGQYEAIMIAFCAENPAAFQNFVLIVQNMFQELMHVIGQRITKNTTWYTQTDK
ncbi:unnamed protein product [Mytilus coruscus]|uniref:Uncharacterized protein n=1 Tax=Mytilus coruscus TaxID=42192 RepID=A0A6J8BW42_MYTCO|nr:unnamed protein product [Mytilus coruscus]